MGLAQMYKNDICYIIMLLLLALCVTFNIIVASCHQQESHQNETVQISNKE